MAVKNKKKNHNKIIYSNYNKKDHYINACSELPKAKKLVLVLATSTLAINAGIEASEMILE